MDCMKLRTQEVSSFSRSWDNSAYVKKWGTPWIRPSRTPKVTDFGTNRKRLYKLLLVCNDILGPISHRFRDIAGFFVLLSDLIPIQLQFWGCSRCTRGPNVGVTPSTGLKLFGREIVFEEFQPVWKTYLNVTEGQTDRHTVYDSITALCVASRGKKQL